MRQGYIGSDLVNNETILCLAPPSTKEATAYASPRVIASYCKEDNGLPNPHAKSSVYSELSLLFLDRCCDELTVREYPATLAGDKWTPVVAKASETKAQWKVIPGEYAAETPGSKRALGGLVVTFLTSYHPQARASSST
jgi:hypothetical protein